ncbi:MAG: hypothetical protein HY966_07710 [Ignavibacteriales bacterium]|nr:hypothetical protein [Ignavibacteriales bacterium]
MENALVSSVLDTFKELPFADKECALEILEKQMVEERRKLLANRVSEARVNYRSGKVKKGSATDLLKDLDRIKHRREAIADSLAGC